MTNSIHWFRYDLRINDNEALLQALNNSNKTLLVYIIDETEDQGGASLSWLFSSLAKLNESLRGKLNVYKGNQEFILIDLIKKHNINKVYFNRCYHKNGIIRDKSIANTLSKHGVKVETFNSLLIQEPQELLNKSGVYYKVFTHFYKASKERLQYFSLLNLNVNEFDHKLIFDNTNLNNFDQITKKNWSIKIMKHWEVGEIAAYKKLEDFILLKLDGYKEKRNIPYANFTSKLSPHLHFGEISPKRIYNLVKLANKNQEDTECFVSEIFWREFSYYLLFHFEDLDTKNFQNKFDTFVWDNKEDHIKKWQNGQTGIPIVDAGMRELFETGYMHNRVRMIVGSFLVKNLLCDWRIGKSWFDDCLVDQDIASNSASWQWVAGTGADAAPYFRIFNPSLQTEKFDPECLYIKKYVPELKNAPAKFLYDTKKYTQELSFVGVKLGKDYPLPIIDTTTSKNEALVRYKNL
jgi:deoxyribodipyrimidine photo-lyase